jgi:hypothetical protein
MVVMSDSESPLKRRDLIAALRRAERVMRFVGSQWSLVPTRFRFILLAAANEIRDLLVRLSP